MPPLSHVAWAWAVAAVVLVIAGVAGAAAGQQKPIKSCPGLNTTGLKLHRTVSETVDAQQDLTVFATALAKAGNLASFFAGYDNGINDTTRYGACYQILAPSDAAFGALPRGLLARLLDPANEAELVEVVSYHVIAGYYGTRWECGVYPQPGPAWEAPFPCDARKPCASYSMASQPITFSCDPDTMLLRATGANRTTASINRPPILATNGDVTVIDSVLLPPWLPPVPPTPPPGPSPSQHLYFRGINPKKKRCGQVDAASSIPPMLFRDDAALRDYILESTDWWGPGRPGFSPVTIEAGTCADAGYGKAGDPSDPDSWEDIAWTKNMFGSVGFDCIDGNTLTGSTCGCPMGQCPDVPPPDQPLCGLCNAASNRPRRVDFWFK